MTPRSLAPIALAVVLGLTFAVRPDAASVKVKANFDKTFDFTVPRTYDWNPKGAGQVILARTQGENPESVRQRAEPVIKEAVAAELKRRNITQAAGSPDLLVTYYLILTVGTSAQTAGQFLPAVADWGLPPFTPSTTALQAVEQGALVLDLGTADRVVWRGIGEAGFSMDLDQAKRASLLREAIKKTLEKYPSKR